MANQKKAPQVLRNWFLIHFTVDMIFALPLFFLPDFFLKSLGWKIVDPVAARLVAAALFGIGISSLLSYHSVLSTYRAMLNLKIIWSFGAIAGIIISLIEGDQGSPPALYLLLIIFAAFNFLWIYWKIIISQRE